MDSEQAKKFIRETFEAPFDKEKYSRFVSNLLKRIDFSKAFHARGYVNETFKKTAEIIKTYEGIGTYTDASAKKIDVLIVYLEKNNSLDKARTTMRNFVAQYLKNRGEKDAALVAFVSPDSEDWRFSLVKMDYSFKETPSGKIKVEEEFTPARRWSFLVGKNEKSHTAQSRFIPIIENDDKKPTLEDLERAFDVEVVTKEFFQKYRDLFIKTKLELDKIVKNNLDVKQEFENKNITTVDFAKKLLGQIIFLYFLQKKGWFGVEKGKPWGTGPKDFIKKLFEKRFGNYQNFYNDILEPLFYEALRADRSCDDHYYNQFNCKIPFLNGGLFDPINDYDWVNTDILIPDKLFSNDNLTKEGDKGDGILDIFDRFNFTVNEEELLEKEVALDPELLGKIYEKLNAIRANNFDEYNQVLKTGKKGEETKFNKEYGVYYTPREIVHYMCQESLINYLAIETSCARDDIEKFVKTSDSIQQKETTSLVKQKSIEVGDIKSTKYKSQLSEYIKNNAKEIDSSLADIKICDPAVGSGAFPIGMMHEIVKLRQLLSIYTGEQLKTYDLKRHAIENSLYGVDIDPGAVEICKLRFWLSMIVDEEDFHNIKPLPNLDYKIVCGNSLLGVEKGLYNYQDFAELEKLKPKYFSETNPTKKQHLKKEIDGLIYEITKGHKEFDFEVYFSEVFHEKFGFDIVIANPPYGNLLKSYEKKSMNGKYSFSTLSDISSPFIERGFNLLKEHGNLVFIITYAITFNKDFSKSRELLVNDFEKNYIYTFDRDRCRIFESMTQTVSIIKCFNKNAPDKKGIFTSRMFRETPDIYKIEVANCNKYLMPKGTNYNQKHRLPKIGEEINKQILEKLLRFNDKVGIIIKNDGSKIWIRTSGNYWYNAFDRKPYDSVDISPLYVDKDFANFLILLMNSSFFYFWFRIYGDGRHMNMDILENFPLPDKKKILQYNVLLSKMEKRFMDKLFSVFDKKHNKFISSSIKSEIDLLDLILGKYFYNLDYNEIVHILNYNSEIRGGNKLDGLFIDLVDKILTVTKDDDYLEKPEKQAKVKEYEHQIDQLVYALYSLSDDEIKIIEEGLL